MRRIAGVLLGAVLFVGLVSPASAIVKSTLTVTKGGTGSGTVTGGGIACGPNCSREFNADDTVTLNAHADPDSTFTGWGGDCTGTGACTVTMDVSRTVTANFAATEFSLKVNIVGTGRGTVTSAQGIDCPGDCTQTFASPQEVTLNAAEGADSEFDSWTGCAPTTAPTCTVTVDANKSVSARFDATAFTLHVRKNGTGAARVTSSPVGIDCGPDCSQTYDAGTEVILSADPDPDSTFVDWSGCTSVTVGDDCRVVMNANRSVTATFRLDTFVLHVRSNGTGVGTVTSDPPGIDCPGDCTATFEADELVVLSADAAANSTFEDWSACAGTGDCTVRMDRDRTVTATFRGRSFDTTLTIGFARQPGRFSGDVVSPSAGCERNRLVQVKKRAVGADVIRAEVVTRRAGRWQASGFRNASGRFYAQAAGREVEEANGATITCRRDTSRTIRLR